MIILDKKNNDIEQLEVETPHEFVVRDELREKRKNIKTFEDLVAFIKDVKENNNSGYGEAPRAMAQAALATAFYLSSEFGITGFQAGFVMRDFIQDWLYANNKCGLKIVDYDNMLYPQYYDKFDKYISPETFEALQKRAEELIEESSGHAHPAVVNHWKQIADGNVPFGYHLKND